MCYVNLYYHGYTSDHYAQRFVDTVCSTLLNLKSITLVPGIAMQCVSKCVYDGCGCFMMTNSVLSGLPVPVQQEAVYECLGRRCLQYEGQSCRLCCRFVMRNKLLSIFVTSTQRLC